MIRRLVPLVALLLSLAASAQEPATDEAAPAEETPPVQGQDSAEADTQAAADADEGEPRPGNERSQAEADMAGEDDFIPSAQISEDLSVSFPVDI